MIAVHQFYAPQEQNTSIYNAGESDAQAGVAMLGAYLDKRCLVHLAMDIYAQHALPLGGICQ